ncbi:MAG: NAD(+) diphosphatase, partial [Pseudomonadota bacterium]|nr:NAD(+) diphosphatase [Pseudomonadota bacterium]
DGLFANREDPIIVPVWQDKNLVSSEEFPKAVFLQGRDSKPCLEKATQLVFLGSEGDTNYLAADLSHLTSFENLGLPKNTNFEDLRQLATSLDPTEAGYLAYARALTHWNRNSIYCGKCASPTKSIRSGHERVCTNTDCAKVHFPRTDSAVIMLVIHPDKKQCLLGCNKRFKGLRYSTLAGFVEPGETFEHAVVREVKEETNIDVENIIYQASQPWPFPASLMVGFTAQATSTEIICSDEELLEAKWFSYKETEDLAKKGDMLPPENYSISRWLIDQWLLNSR